MNAKALACLKLDTGSPRRLVAQLSFAGLPWHPIMLTNTSGPWMRSSTTQATQTDKYTTYDTVSANITSGTSPRSLQTSGRSKLQV